MWTPALNSFLLFLLIRGMNAIEQSVGFTMPLGFPFLEPLAQCLVEVTGVELIPIEMTACPNLRWSL